MAKVHLTSRAREDLLDIWAYIGADNPYAADRVLEAIHRRLQHLARYLHLGLLRDDIGPGIRHLVAGPYLALYRVTDEAVEILQVLHGRRKIGPDSV